MDWYINRQPSFREVEDVHFRNMILAANPEVEFPGRMSQCARVLAEVEVEEAFVLGELEKCNRSHFGY